LRVPSTDKGGRDEAISYLFIKKASIVKDFPIMTQSVSDLIPILQVSIGPVILISGVGLLLLTLTNRLGRIVDRSRILFLEMQKEESPDRKLIPSQI
jgi:hypothetical protein